eukprot:3031229-Alexandrium_andersonii.AAC.1
MAGGPPERGSPLLQSRGPPSTGGPSHFYLPEAPPWRRGGASKVHAPRALGLLGLLASLALSLIHISEPTRLALI